MESKHGVKPLRPLTKRTDEGKLYARDAKHVRHIRRALSVPVHALENWIRAFGYGEKRYADLPEDAPSPEALVYLYRHFRSEVKRFEHERRAHARAQAERILRALLEGIHAAVASHLPSRKLKGVPPNRKAACVEEVELDVLTRLNDPGDAADPLEIAFGLYMKRLSNKAAARYRERAINEIPPPDTLANHEDDAPDLTWLLDSERAEQAVEQLPPNLKIVVKRRMLQDTPPTQADLADELGVSERTIRNRERDAEAALRKLLSKAPG